MVKSAIYNTGVAVTGTAVITTTVADVGIQLLLVLVTVVVTPLLSMFMQKMGATKQQTDLAENALNIWTQKVKELTDKENQYVSEIKKLREDNDYLKKELLSYTTVETGE